MIAFTVLTVLSFMSCASSRRQARSLTTVKTASGADSARSGRRGLVMAGLPASALTLKIPVPDLLALPAGASYHGKNGQAAGDGTSRGDTGGVTSPRDSPPRLVPRYEEELTRIRGDTVSVSEVSETEFKRRFSPVQIALVAFIAGVASGIVLTVLIKRRYGKE